MPMWGAFAVAAITSGTIDGVTIGGTTKAVSVNAGRFTTDAAAGQTQINYATAADSEAKSILWLRSRGFGTVTAAESNFPARVGPYKFSFTDNAVSPTVPVAVAQVLHIASGDGGATGANVTREALHARLQVTGQYGTTGYLAFTPLQTIAYSTSNQAGVTGWTAAGASSPDVYYRGGHFGGCTTAWLASGATFYRDMTGLEVDWGAYAGSSLFAKCGLALVKDASDAVAGVGSDSGLKIAAGGAGTAPIGVGVQFGDEVAYWPFDATSTLVGAVRRGTSIGGTAYAGVPSPEAAVNANTGIDFTAVTFATAAIATPSFLVGPGGTANYARVGSTAANMARMLGAAIGSPVVIGADPASADTNLAVVLGQPKGTGGVSAHLADNGTGGGSARGANAVDWQSSRSAASQVASGTYSVVSGGTGGTASGNNSVVAGGSGNVASGNNSWVPGGAGGSTRGIAGRGAWAAGQFAAPGDAQAGEYVLRVQTTNGTATRVTTDAGAASGTNNPNLPSSSAYAVLVLVVGRQTSAAGGRYCHTQRLLVARDVGVGTATVDLGASEIMTHGTVTGWSVAITADTTNGGIAVTVTGAAATTINWVARIISVEVVG